MNDINERMFVFTAWAGAHVTGFINQLFKRRLKRPFAFVFNDTFVVVRDGMSKEAAEKEWARKRR